VPQNPARMNPASAAEGKLPPAKRDVIPNRAESPVRNLLGFCVAILRKRSRTRKRATPNEEPALSLPKGPMQLAGSLPKSIVMLTLPLTGKGTAFSRATKPSPN
jgi:hypothetical protein